MRRDGLGELAALMEAAHRADAAALARLKLKAEDLRRRADALRAPVAPAEGADALAMAAADRHGLWRASRRRELLGELALARAEIEGAREKARRSFGRARAAEALAARGTAKRAG